MPLASWAEDACPSTIAGIKGSAVRCLARSFSPTSFNTGRCGADELRLRPTDPGSAKSRPSVEPESETPDKGLVTELFEGNLRILMLEGVRRFSREPPPIRGLLEAFAREEDALA